MSNTNLINPPQSPKGSYPQKISVEREKRTIQFQRQAIECLTKHLRLQGITQTNPQATQCPLLASVLTAPPPRAGASF